MAKRQLASDLHLEDDLTILNDSKKQKTETGSSSSPSSQCFCEICTEEKPTEEMFNNNNNCVYSFCFDCIIKHITIKVQQNNFINNNKVSCPGIECVDHVLELEACSSFLPKKVVEKWNEALVESAILGSNKFYCPFKDCSATLIEDGEEGEVIRQGECPICHRLFCARCYVPWHSGLDCEEFQMMNEDEGGREDLMVKELAEKSCLLVTGCSNFCLLASDDGRSLLISFELDVILISCVCLGDKSSTLFLSTATFSAECTLMPVFFLLNI